MEGQSTQALADQAIQDLHAAIRAAKALLSALAQPATGAAPQQQPSEAEVQARQEEYLTHTHALRHKLKALAAQRQATSTEAAEEAQPATESASDEQIVQLQKRKDELVQQVCAAAEVEAQLMSQTRMLLDMLSLWENHKRHLEAPPTGR